MTAKAEGKKCDKPASGAVRLGGSPEVFACAAHIEDARDRSAKAGKKALSKSLTKAQAAAITGANRDDALPINVRGLSEVEREIDIPCLNHLLDKWEVENAAV